MKPFEQVAQTYKELSLLYMMNRSKPIYRTGNLYNTVDKYNTPGRMQTVRRSRAKSKIKLETPSVNISLSFAPPGARYGTFVHDGTSKMPARPFAEEAANDRRLKKAIDNAVGGIVDDTILPQIRKDIDKAFKKFLK